MLPSAVLTQVKGTHLAACGPLPVTIGKWVQPACSTAVQQLKPSLTNCCRGKVALGEHLDLLLAEALDDGEPQTPRLALGRRLDRGHERRLAGRTAPAFAAERSPPR